jgi:hypothetical protein
VISHTWRPQDGWILRLQPMRPHRQHAAGALGAGTLLLLYAQPLPVLPSGAMPSQCRDRCTAAMRTQRL